jgi:NADH-quinone oxidoreductase subunit C
MFFNLQQQKLWVLKSHLKTLKILGGSLVKETRLKNNEIEVKTTKNNLRGFFLMLKKSTFCRYEQLVDIAVTDVLGKINRFSINYLLKSLLYSTRLTVVVKTNEVIPVSSIMDIYKSSNWLEREVWDFYGIFFNDHLDLRRILTDYGFAGHPLRKDFPLTGFNEIFYDDSSKKILYEPVELTQEYRSFTLETPWVLPYQFL